MPTVRYATFDVLDQPWKLSFDLFEKNDAQALTQVCNTKIRGRERPEVTLDQKLCLYCISILVLVAGVEVPDDMPAKIKFDLLIPRKT
jgi:hypothetical protein